MMEPLTPQERKAIAALKRLANKWPRSLWLWSASGNLCVMKTKPDGTRAMDGGHVDPAYKVTTIREIGNDGGDW